MADAFSLLFWFLFLFLVLWPQLQHRFLLGARLSLIRKIEAQRNSRVITLIHRQERISLFGIPFFRFIDIEDSEEILRAIRMTPPDMPIDLILHTPGGLVLASYQIARALKDHPGKTTVIIPHYAMSGGTLIALAADEVLMDPHAVLGPVDPQLSTGGSVVPAASILKAVEAKGKENVEDSTLMMADVAEKAVNQVERMILELLDGKMDPEKARETARTLAEGRWTHDFPITLQQARALGIPVREGIPEEVYELMRMYPQAQQMRPGVEFIPSPYFPRGERGQHSA